MAMKSTGSFQPRQRQGLYTTFSSTIGVRTPQMSSRLGQITAPSEARWRYRIWRMALSSPTLTSTGEVLPCPPFCQSSGLFRHSSFPVPASRARRIMLAA